MRAGTVGERGRAADGAVLALLDPEGKFLQRLAGDQRLLKRLSLELWTLPKAQLRSRLDRLAVLAHRLAGAAETFGFAAIGARAIALEDAVGEGRDHREIEALMAKLAAALQQGLRGA
jgi:HPt (histidine-containing phosphotransfer) domain-containing protein